MCIRSSPAVSAISLGTADANPFCQKSGRQIETVDIFALEFRSASVYFPFLKLKEKKSRSISNRLSNNQENFPRNFQTNNRRNEEEASKFISNFAPRVFSFFKVKKKEIEIASATIRDRGNFPSRSFQTNNRSNG